MEIAVPALVIGTALSAGGEIMKAREQSAAAKFEQDQLNIQAQQSRTAAAQIEAQRRQELEQELGTISTIWAARGVGADSPTSRAIEDAVISDNSRQLATERTNLLQRADTSRRAGEFAGRRASMALTAGYIGAGEKIAGGFFKYSRIGT